MDINSTDDFSAKPYFEDFKREKHQYKILFKPGYAVQARELNNLQAQLQDQINVLGHHLFKNGSMVIPGTPRYNPTLSYVFVDKVTTDTTLGQRLQGKYLTEMVDITEDVKIRAMVENWIDYGDKAMLLVNYMSSATITEAGQVVNKTTFSPNTELTIEDSTDIIQTSVASNDPTNVPVIGTASTLSVAEGVYFVDGFFVHTPEQKIVVGFNNEKLTIKAGFEVVKSIQTAYDDVTLFDNALGSENEAAPGADRFVIDLKLTTLPVNDDVTNFIELIRLDRGFLRVANINPNYNVLADTLARRTYDESGDYAVHGFDIKVYEDLKDDTNPSGLLTADEGGDPNLFVAEISKGKGYVKGYETENLSNYFIEANKARTKDCEATANDVIQVNEYGEYIYMAPGNQFFDISKHPIIWLTDGQESTANVIGYCIPKFVDSVNISGQTIFKLYGTFQLASTATFGWQNLGGWRLNGLKNGPVLQVLNLTNVVSDFNVVDGQPLTSHTGYTPFAWDRVNAKLYVKKSTSAPVFDMTRAVTKGSASGYVVSINYKISNPAGAGELFALSIKNIKTTKDAQGNFELQSDLAYSGIIQTNAAGYGEYIHLGNGVFVDNPVAAHTGIDNAYFDNLVTIEDAGKKLVINNVNYPNASFAISASLRKSMAVKSKALAEASTLITKPSSRKMFLKHQDVYKIKHVYVSADPATAPTTADEDVAKYFDIVNGDTLDFYSASAIKSKGGFGVPAGQMLVVYDHFIHGAGDVFTADSYVSLRDNVADESDVTHIGRIPLFVTKDRSYVLSDMLDFRKSVRDGFFIIRANVTAGSTDILVPDDYQNVVSAGAKIFSVGFEGTPATIVSVTDSKFVASISSTVTGTVYMVVNAASATSAAEPFETSQALWSAVSGSTVTYDATYFMDRWDRIAIDTKGAMRYVYGTPGITKYPETPADSMSLATLIVPAYTRNASLIKFSKDDNRRYTMRDIGNLDKRIANLEYYTTLTMKELDTKNIKILDADGFDRFKSGLFVSNFKDYGVFDPFNAETPYRATLVPETNKMIPLEFADYVPLKFSEPESTAYKVIGNKIYMPFTEKVEIQQPYATHYQTVNPYLVIQWSPEMVINPSTDAWVETEWAPVITNISNVVRNTESASYESNTSTIYRDLPDRVISTYSGTNNVWWGGTATTNTTSSVNVTQSSTTNRTSTTTNTTDYSSSTTSSTRLVGTSVIPLMRTREVQFTMVSGKPSTRYWVRFDNQDVSLHCCPYDPMTQVRGTFGEALVSDGMGKLTGIFKIPPGTFKTGERILELSDVDMVTEPDALPQCVATATYTANGTLQTMQEIVNTVNTTTNNTHITYTDNTQIVVSRQNVINHQTVYADPPARTGDPLAQTFFTTELDGPGMFVTKVDLYFAKKDNTAPAWFEMKEVVNGSPANGRIPGSLVVINPQDVPISADSTVPTEIVFDQPIYLQANREYALVVGSPSARYAVWVAKMGEKIINEDRVLSEQPSLGSLFKSQNNSTWTPYQLEDIKFRVHRAQFDTSVQSRFVFTNDGTGAKRKLTVSKLYTTSGSNMLRIYHPNHGTLVNEYVNLYPEDGIGIAGNSPLPTDSFNGVLMSDVYGKRLVKQVISINEYMIELPAAASATGYFEDVGKYFYGSSNVNFHDYRVSVNDFIPGQTQVRYSTELITGKDFDGGQTTQVNIPEMFIKNKENNHMADLGLVQITDNESTTKSMKVNAYLTTQNDCVAPVLELANNGVNISSLALNKPDADDEDNPIDGSVNSKAITQLIRLATLSNSIRVYTAENKQEKDGVEIWVRFASDRDIQAKTWVKMEPKNIAVQADLDTYVEHERSLDGLPAFDEYQIKVIFKGTDSTRYPSINELRAITVAS